MTFGEAILGTFIVALGICCMRGIYFRINEDEDDYHRGGENSNRFLNEFGTDINLYEKEY